MDETQEFLKGAILGYVQAHSDEEISEVFKFTFDHLSRGAGLNLCANIFETYFKLNITKESKNG